MRRVYHGLLTYSANWDDVDDTVILGDLDVIGINAFYPLADEAGASAEKLREGGERVRGKVHALAERWQQAGPLHRDRLHDAPRSGRAPLGVARRDDPREGRRGGAGGGLPRRSSGPLLEEPDFAGFFVWRVYADPDDVSQEAPWGFSPRGKQAELVVRDAFAARWASDPWWMRPRWTRAGTPGLSP